MPAQHPRLPHRFPHRGLLPEGRHATLTWALPDDMGPLTAETIARCNAFAAHDNRPVDLLTLTPDQDIPARAQQLRAAGILHRRVRVRNLWDELLTWSDKRLGALEGTVRPDDAHSPKLLARKGAGRTETRKSDAGKVLQIDRYRADGTPLVADVRDTQERGKPGGRCIILCSHSGDALAEWHTAREFYWAWLDALFGTDPTYLLIDSPFVAGFMHNYRRENIATGAVLHDGLTAAGADSAQAPQPNAPVEPSMLQLVSHLDAFDATICGDAGRAHALTRSHAVDDRLVVLPYPALDDDGGPTAVADWGQALSAVRFDRLRPWERPRASLVAARTDDRGLEITVGVDYASGRIPGRAYLTWKSTDRRFFGRVPGTWGVCAVSATVPQEAFAGVPDDSLELLVDLVQPRDFARMKVSAGTGTIDNDSAHLSVRKGSAGRVRLDLTQDVTAPR